MIANVQQNPIAPWLQPLWDSMDFNQFPNAILLHGQSGIGKFEFAVTLAKSLLCEGAQDTSRPCNQCVACHWFNAGNHPDFIALVPETHRKLLPRADYETDEAPRKGKAARDDADGDIDAIWDRGVEVRGRGHRGERSDRAGGSTQAVHAPRGDMDTPDHPRFPRVAAHRLRPRRPQH